MITNQKIRKEKLNQILIYVRDEISKEHYPSYKELKKRYIISYYGIKLGDIYPNLGMNILNLPFKRPQSSLNELRKDLIIYIKNEVTEGHYPSRRYIEKKFKLNLVPDLFDSIQDLYTQAGIEYVQENSQELKNKKARILTNIIISLLPKFNLKLIEVRDVYSRGIDILAKNSKGELIGIEVKAHNKYEPIKRRNFLQLKRFLIKEKLDRIVLVTTSSKFENSVDKPDNLEIIDYEKLKQLCNNSQFEDLEYVRNVPIHQVTNERLLKKKLIIDFVRKLSSEGKSINHRDICKKLRLRTFTYFDSINEIYVEAGLSSTKNKVVQKD